MPETKRKMQLLGTDTEVADVPIVKSDEVFNYYELEDGTKLKVKNVATSIIRIEGQYMPLPDGRPIYIVLSSPVVNVESSPLTKKQ
jgi:hypothetical protein